MTYHDLVAGLSERWLRCAVGEVAACDAAEFLYQLQLRDFVATSTSARGIILRSRPYQVALSLDARGLHHECDCRHAEYGAMCRHAAAVALAWIHSPQAPPPGSPARPKTMQHFGPWVEGISQHPQIRQQALERLRGSRPTKDARAPFAVDYTDPAYQLVGCFLDEGDGDAAWNAAWEFGASTDQWAHLVALRSRTQGAVCLPIYDLLIETSILKGNGCEYMTALRWLGEARWVAAKAKQKTWFDETVEDLRARHKRRRKFTAMLTDFCSDSTAT